MGRSAFCESLGCAAGESIIKSGGEGCEGSFENGEHWTMNEWLFGEFDAEGF